MVADSDVQWRCWNGAVGREKKMVAELWWCCGGALQLRERRGWLLWCPARREGAVEMEVEDGWWLPAWCSGVR